MFEEQYRLMDAEELEGAEEEKEKEKDEGTEEEATDSPEDKEETL